MKACIALALVLFAINSTFPAAVHAADIAGREIVLDDQGKLLPWAQGDSPYDAMMKLAWGRLKTFPNEWNGLPTYYTYPRFIGTEHEDQPFLSGIGWAHNPASLNTMIWDSALEYAAYSGDEDVIHAAAPLVARYHSTLRLTPSARSTCGANPSSRLARVMVNRFSPPRSCMP